MTMTIMLHDAEPVDAGGFRNGYVCSENYEDGTRKLLVVADRYITHPWVSIWQDEHPLMACLVHEAHEGETITIDLDAAQRAREQSDNT